MKKTIREYVANNDTIRILIDVDNEDSVHFCDDLYQKLSVEDLDIKNVKVFGVTEEEPFPSFDHEVLDELFTGIRDVSELVFESDESFMIFISNNVAKCVDFGNQCSVMHRDCICLPISSKNSKKMLSYVLIRNQIERKLKPSWRRLVRTVKQSLKRLFKKE